MAKSIFTLRMNARKFKKSIVFDFATSIRSGHQPYQNVGIYTPRPPKWADFPIQSANEAPSGLVKM